MTKEYYELRNNRIDSENWENIKMGLVIFREKAKEVEREAFNGGNKHKAEHFRKVCKSIEKTLDWLNSNIDSYPSMEFEKTRKAKSVGNTMGQFDIYLDEFIEKEN